MQRTGGTPLSATAAVRTQQTSVKDNQPRNIPAPLNLKASSSSTNSGAAIPLPRESLSSRTIPSQSPMATIQARSNPLVMNESPTTAASSLGRIPTNGENTSASGVASSTASITNRTTRKRSPVDFQFLECIGEGSYSNVYRAVSKSTGHTYAIKVLNKQHIHKEKKRKYVTIEKNTLNMLGKHPGIVTLYYTFQDPKSLYFVIDYASNGELLSLIHDLGTLSLELTHYYTVQLIDTIAFIHNKGIIHRDLKPENILLSKGWKLMITDFGAAKIVDEAKNTTKQNDVGSQMNTPSSADGPPVEFDNENEDETDGSTDNEESISRNGSFVGTAEYISPELLKYNQSSFASDFWSLGCIIYQMLVGRPPFKASNEYATFERIVDVVYSFPDPTKYPIPSAAVEVIRKLLLENPTERLGLETIKLQKWFNNVNWDDKDRIWGPVPKLEPYRPERYFQMKQPVQHQLKKPEAVKTTMIKPQKVQSAPNSAVSTPVKKIVPLKPAAPNHVYKPSIVQNNINDKDKPDTVLKKQLQNAQNNANLMNKVLTNRIDEKNPTIGKRLVDSKIGTSPVSPNTNQQQAIKNSSDPLAGLQVNQKRLSKTPTSSPKMKSNGTLEKRKTQNSVDLGAQRKSTVSLSSMFTSGDSSKSVIITSKASKLQPLSSPPSTNATNTIDTEKPSIPVKEIAVPTGKEKKPQPPKQASSASTTSFKQQSKIAQQQQKQQQHKFIPKPRIASSDAAAAAGAIGTLLTHTRNLKSVSSTTTQHKQLKNHQKQLINPVLLDKQIPSVITSKLMQHETILKLDNIFKSELSHKPNQFTSPGETLNHTILEDIVYRYERDLEKDFKSCIMVITSNARLFIYELNDDFRLNNPQSSTMMQAQDFYLKIVEIKLTNKNVSLYDYEFDEEMHEGFLILELSNVNKLIFLSAWDRSRFVRGGLNSNVRVGFHVNENETWVKSFMNAKNLLKRKEMRAQSNLNKPKVNHSTPSNSKVRNTSDEHKPKSNRSGSGSGVQQTLRNLKSNTSNRIRSLSTSSGVKEPSIRKSELNASTPPSPRDGVSSPESAHGSLLNGMKELALGVRSGFKSKDNQLTGNTIESNGNAVGRGNVNGNSKITNSEINGTDDSPSVSSVAKGNDPALTKVQIPNKVVRRKSMQVVNGNVNNSQANNGSRAAMAAALAVGKRK